MALLITLLVMVILAVLIHRFTFATRVHLAAASNLRDQLQAECLARSGMEAALTIMEQDEEPEVDHLGEPWALFRGSEDLDSVEMPEGSFGVRIQDESAKVNINLLITSDGSPDPFILDQIGRLLEIFDLTPDRIDALLDWLDPDDDRRTEGAENSDYQALERPYPCRNGPLRTVGEMQLIMGWGDILDVRLEDGTALVDCFTVGPTEGGVNINTASEVVLQSLDSEIDEFVSSDIVALREETPLESTESLRLASGVTDELYERVQDHIQVNAGLVSIHSQGLFRRAVFSIHALVVKSEGDATPIQWRMD
jgi:general secretion pathway protein K